MKTKKILALVLAFTLAFSMLAGCKGSDEPSADVQNSPEMMDDQQRDDVTLDGDSKGESVVRDEINVAIAADLGTWDPFNLTSNEGRQGVYQSLGYFIDGEYYPSLMKSYELNEDMTLISCELFDNIYDSNGVHMTAADVVWSYEMASAGTTLAVGDIVESCNQTGEYTFEFVLRDTLQLGRIDKIVRFFIVCRESYENSPDHMATTPVGTGPLELTNLVSGYSFTLERRDDYWQTDESQRCYLDYANAKTVNYYIISESAQRAIALQNGTIDMVTSLSAEELELIKQDDRFWLYSRTADKSVDFAPNCDESSPMSDINLRLACFYAINPEALVTGVFKGAATVNSSMAPDWSVDFQEQWKEEENYYTVYDPDLAKEYLAKSNYKGEKLKIICQSGSNSSAAAQIILGMLQEVGISCEINALERNIFSSYQANADQWDISVYETACNTYWLDAANGQLTQNKTTWGSSINFIYNDELQEMLQECMSLKNYSDELNNELHHYIIDNAYWYSMVNYISYMVVPSWCSNVALNPAKQLYAAGCTFTE